MSSPAFIIPASINSIVVTQTLPAACRHDEIVAVRLSGTCDTSSFKIYGADVSASHTPSQNTISRRACL